MSDDRTFSLSLSWHVLLWAVALFAPNQLIGWPPTFGIASPTWSAFFRFRSIGGNEVTFGIFGFGVVDVGSELIPAVFFLHSWFLVLSVIPNILLWRVTKGEVEKNEWIWTPWIPPLMLVLLPMLVFLGGSIPMPIPIAALIQTMAFKRIYRSRE